MSGFTFGVDAVYAAQRYSRELVESVWSACFYEYLIDVLTNDTWKEYSTKAYGRPCRFIDVREFLTHEDGLAWPAIGETLRMIRVVKDCTTPLPPEKNAASTKPLKEWAKDALDALAAAGVGELNESGQQAQPLAQHGTNQHREQEGGDSVTTSSKDRGQAYLLRRLARDAPEILERVKAGEFKSARAAAIEAGIIKPVPTVRLVDDLTVVATKLCQHLTREQRIELIDLLAPDL